MTSTRRWPCRGCRRSAIRPCSRPRRPFSGCWNRAPPPGSRAKATRRWTPGSPPAPKRSSAATSPRPTGSAPSSRRRASYWRTGRRARPGAAPEFPSPQGKGRKVARSGLTPYRRAMPSALYNRDILRLAAAIPCLGRLDAPQGSAERTSKLCGSRVAVDIVLDDEDRVAALGQDVRACALGQASAALMASQVVGRTEKDLAGARNALAAYLRGETDEPGDWPGLAVFAAARAFPARHAAILLPFEAAVPP